MTHVPEEELPEEFAREFRALMDRLTARFAALTGAADDSGEHARLRSDVAREFAREAAELIARHGVGDAAATYVRHVVREGFDVDFDLMDPTNVALEARAKRVPDPSGAKSDADPDADPDRRP